MIAKILWCGKILLVALVLSYSQVSFSQNCPSSGTINVTGTEVWDINSKGTTNLDINQSICVETGGVLTIENMNILMKGNFRITVHKGGTLNLRNVHIKPKTGFPLWEGIFVMGENSQPLCDEVAQTLNTTDHGKLMADGSTFEGCFTAIRLMDYTDPDASGGIMSVNNCTFYNVSSRGIHAGSSYSLGNCFVNSVANSWFLNHDADLSPRAFIELISYRGFTILGCTFEILSSLKKSTIGVIVRERLTSSGGFLTQAEHTIIEASEYINPYLYPNSPKHSQPKRNKFINLEKGILFSGNPQGLTPFEAIVKACDFDRVWMALDIQHAQNITVSCNTYIAKIYNPSMGFNFTYTQNEEDKDGNWTLMPAQSSPTFLSVFAYCFNIHGGINFYENQCEWDADFQNRKAAGIIFNYEYDPNYPGNYIFSGNTFKYSSTEGGEVTGLLIHGKFDWSTDIVANTFDKLYRDIHLKGFLIPEGSTCFYPVLNKQGYVEGPPESSFGKGNIFSNPPGDGTTGNIYSDAADIFYVKPGLVPPDYDPNYRSACVSVYTAVGNNAPAISVECDPIPVPGLLDDGRDLFSKNRWGYCLDISPNPFRDIINIDLSKNLSLAKANSLTLVIYTSQGVQKYLQTIDPQISFIEIDSKLWSPGLYLATLQDGNKLICSTKIIKE